MKKYTIGFVGLLLLGIVTFLLLDIDFNQEIISDENVITLTNLKEIKELQPLDSYGYPEGVYKVEEKRVRRNQSLYILLQNLDVQPTRIHAIQKELNQYIDPRKILPGQRYVTYYDQTSNEPVRMIYHPNALNYVVIDWEDGLVIESGEKEIDIETKEATGLISSSLYETLMSQDLNPNLAYSLSEIFAWQIDFFRLYKGDHFKVIYEERFVDGRPYGIEKIVAAEFTHRGETYEVFHFDNGEQIGYFDEDGKSVQKVLLKAPFTYNQRISSGYSHNRFHPVLKRRMPHYGVDYAAPLGTPVISVGDGEVIESRYRGPNGNIVKIRHNGTYTTAYLHLDGFAKGIKKGKRVKQGQVIGYVGRTGRVTGVHLDYRVYVNNQPVNPLSLKLPASKSVYDENMDDFLGVKNRLQFMLSGIEEAEAAS